jgi:hypothetical protein
MCNDNNESPLGGLRERENSCQKLNMKGKKDHTHTEKESLKGKHKRNVWLNLSLCQRKIA